MPDTVHDDQLAEAFTRFRSEARGEILPPGTHAVRRAARRRRTILVACAAAAVTLLGAGVAMVTTVDRPGPEPLAYPTLEAAELEDLGALAYKALPKAPLDYGFSAAVTAQTRGETRLIGHGGSSPLKFQQGVPYELRALCLGRGTVMVAWEAPGGTGSIPVICGGDAVRVPFTPRADSPLVQFRLTPDAEAVGRAGIAVAIIEFM